MIKHSTAQFSSRTFFFLLIACCISLASHAQFRVKSYAENAAVNIIDVSFLNPSTGYVAYETSVGFTQDSGSTCTNIPITYANTDINGLSVNLLSGFRVSGVRAFTMDSLLVFGDYGAAPAILFSKNHGTNWKIIYHRPITNIDQFIGFTMSDMVFPGNGNTGIAVNDKDILRSTDRGQTWQVVAQISDNISSRFTRLSFPTNTVGYALAGNLLFTTSNGGVTWAQVSLPANDGGLNFENLSFISPSTGYLTKKDNQTIYKTTNSTATWLPMNDVSKFPVVGTDLHFINDSTGFFATRSGLQVYKTSDNGKTWERCKRDGDFDNPFVGMKRLFFYNDNTAWASGDRNLLLLTTNAGGKPFPKACFDIDTTGLDATGMVHLTNCSKPAYSFTWLRNGVPFSTGYNASYTHDFFNPRDTIQLIVFNGTDKDTLTQEQIFTLPAYTPAITYFNPATGSVGTSITIVGSGFTLVNSVKIGGVKADSFIVVTDNIITAVVAGGASGTITVSDKYSSNSKPGFTFFAPPAGKAPVVSSIVPNSGLPGTLVTISGSNFNTSPSGNIVSFGAVNAPVISATATQLTCKVPLGTSMEPVHVYNTATSLSGRSRKPFTVTFADSAAFTIASFQLNTSIEYSNVVGGADKYPLYSIGKDIDGDGKPDLVTAKTSPDSIAVYRNITNGKTIAFDLAKQTGIKTSGSSKFRIEDMDGDGRADIAYSAGGVFIAKNLSSPGNIVFAPKEQVQTTIAGSDLALGDLDGDGRNDIASTAYSTVQLTRNTSLPGYLSFGMPLILETVEVPDDIAIADLDGDGKNDIIAHNASFISCFRNTSTAGKISVAPIANFPLDQSVNTEGKSLFVADYDLDGKLDVIVFDRRFFAVFRNTSTAGNLSFDDAVYTQIADYYGDGWGGCVANLSGDQKPDVLVGGLLLYRNTSANGNTSFEAGITMSPQFPSSMNTADFDLDGKPDVIATSPVYSTTYIYRNHVGEPGNAYACLGAGSFSLPSNMTGTTYQWQQDDGSGYKDIADNAWVKGTNSNTLSFDNAPTLYNGYVFRCKVDNQSYSLPLRVVFESRWGAYVDDNWETPGNWTCGVLPDKYCDVIIQSGTVNINSNVEVRSLKVLPGAGVNVKPGASVKVVK